MTDIVSNAAANIARHSELFRTWAWAEPDPETPEGRAEIRILELYRERERLRADQLENGADVQDEIDATTVEMEQAQRAFSLLTGR